MGKIWLKSVDPAKQCCGCEGKTSPCDTCCSFDLTPFEGIQASKSVADALFYSKTRDCTIYLNDTSYGRREIHAGVDCSDDKKNVIQSEDWDCSPRKYIDKDEIVFYHTNSLPRLTNGTLTIETSSVLKDTQSDSKKIDPPREDFCEDNKVRYYINPPLAYDVELFSTIKTDQPYSFSSAEGVTEIDVPEKEYLEFNTEKDYSTIGRWYVVTTEICCQGTKYQFKSVNGVTDNCRNYDTVRSKSGFFNREKNDGTVYRRGSHTSNYSVSNLRFDRDINRWKIDVSIFITNLNYVPWVDGRSPYQIAVQCNIISFGSVGLYWDNANPDKWPLSKTVTLTSIGNLISFPIHVGVRDYVYGFYDPAVGDEFYIIPNCDDLINYGDQLKTPVPEFPECNKYYACQKKDNVVITKEKLENGAYSRAECPESQTTEEDLKNKLNQELEGSGQEVTANILAIVAVSLTSMAGGAAVGYAAVAATGLFGLALAGALIYYSVKQGVTEQETTSGETSYSNSTEQGTEDPSCEDIGEGNILKTIEQYDVVGKRILFSSGEPPNPVLPYAPKYKYTMDYIVEEKDVCILFQGRIARKSTETYGFCSTTLSNYDNIKFAFQSSISDSKGSRNLMKKIFVNVTNPSSSSGYSRYNCS